VFLIKDEILSFGILPILSSWNDMGVQETLDVRVESVEIQGMTIQVITLYYVSLTLRSESMSIEWEL